MPMREDCRHYQSRTYASGEVARFCVLDMAPDAPWRCPDNCPSTSGASPTPEWTHGKLVEPPLEPEPSDVPAADAADLLENAEEIVSAVAPEAIEEARKRERKEERRSGRRRFRVAWMVQAQGLSAHRLTGHPLTSSPDHNAITPFLWRWGRAVSRRPGMAR